MAPPSPPPHTAFDHTRALTSKAQPAAQAAATHGLTPFTAPYDISGWMVAPSSPDVASAQPSSRLSPER